MADGDIAKTPVITWARDIKSAPLDWLWQERIPLGKLSILAGVQGKGKSTLALYMAAQVSTGRPWIDTFGQKRDPGSVIVLSMEDDWIDTIKPRLQAAEADMSKVCRVDGFAAQIGNRKFDCVPLSNLTRDFDVLEQAVEQIGDVRLIIVDPISSYMMGKNENKNAEMREFLNPLIAMGGKNKIAILGITHLNKNQDLSPDHRILGSTALAAAARAVWLVHQDEDVSERRLMVLLKENLSPNSTGLAFRPANASVMTDVGKLTNAPYCMFEAEVLHITAKDVLMAKPQKAGRPKKRNDAADWLYEYLENGPKPAKQLIYNAAKAGYSERTLRSVKKNLEIQSYKSPDDDRGETWVWALPT